uniref:Galectin n=1 Tax=Drosophila melanogaster TaxID=7227 RepID=Q9VEW5_DROME|nr:uncharacterized protein Dmel_CG14879, isoform C [Drosophila melanogaster]NP_001287363.1 uncharacterized protein Dmel_CG14879, isoform D [Drosophila melanogaster]NP_732131.1 uncharacterized protein Dmel_CG14879, isoform A [Drosophila melanogaster]AAF55302.1 uncharacterized protein Dmel_CG14879, isoform A [Drosophila melanogaster]AGB96009.1 uncharacterized protein Dmel_CG14879, isoform C [Drosophila melanogaster]AHN57362.1 uncharacterized protein Dmel_CG14879, isoform D [Drosophila melanogast|eukprot:NP_001262629.1 uncharacterized protein Dmel_CG14879, isoform C [Drosophila melanogaster]
MPDVKFFAVLPTNASTSDRVTRLSISGNLLQDPQQFSVNFVNSPDCTDNITYHFKVVIPTQTIIENYKRNGEWSSLHQEKYLNIFDGTGASDKNPNMTESFARIITEIDEALQLSSTESSFCLEFAFDYANSMMRVYQGRDSGHNFITEYETLFSLSDIQAVQVWGDVQKVNQFALSYN